MSGLELKNVQKRYGDVEVIHGANLKVEPGEFCVFVDPRDAESRRCCG